MKVIGPLFAIAAFLVVIYGYIMNIVSLATSEALILTGENVVRIIGIFVAPVGVIMGLFV